MSVALSLTEAGTVLEAVRDSLLQAGRYNPNDVERPAAILWADDDEQWSPIIPQLQSLMPELLTFGDYQPEAKKGPAIWLRCVLERTLGEVELPEEAIPIIYLPGVSRQTLHAAEDCPNELKPLVELQYRGVYWTQKNGRDWTVEAFLLSEDGGLSLDLARDAATRRSLHIALAELMITPIQNLTGKRLEAEDFNRLLVPDPVKDMLTWLNAPESTKDSWTDGKWTAFRSDCLANYDMDPDKDGELVAAERFGNRQGIWLAVWNRFAESPALYPGIQTLLRKVMPTKGDLFADLSAWPQHNEEMESQLREGLSNAGMESASKTRKSISSLEKVHGPRREWVWAKLGQSPLADALKYLMTIAEGTASNLGGTSRKEMAVQYTDGAWKVDLAVLDALAATKSDANRKAVGKVISCLYLPWLEASAEHLQKLIDEDPIPDAQSQEMNLVKPEDGSLFLFVDGLRLDIAQRLVDMMTGCGWEVNLTTRWVGLPTITATAKPAASPIAERLSGELPGEDFLPSITDSGQSLQTYHFRKLLTENGYQVIDSDESGDPKGRGWTEYGEFDKLGHSLTTKLADRVGDQLNLLIERIQALFEAGWKSLRVVTDHGWLLMPGGLPKVELPKYLTVSRWPRCASIKGESKVQVPTVPWYWNSQHRIAIAPGIACFRSGQEYSHGGASLQECLVPDIEVVPGKMLERSIVTISQLKWFGLRCRIQLQEPRRGLRVDLRTKVNDPTSSVTQPKTIDPEEGSASLLIEDDSLESESATVVVIDDGGHIITKKPTIIGGEN